MKFHFPLLLSLLITSALPALAQEDLLKELQAETPPAKRENVFATFKGNNIINIETNETVRKQNLDFRINHQFGNIGEKSGGGFHTLYGFDQSYDIRIGIHYGITDRLMAGLARSKRHENLEGLLKYRAIQQTTDNHIPVAVTIFANMTYSMISGELVTKDAYRFTYLTQAIIARKFSSKFSVVVTPSLLHRNVVEANDKNDLVCLGAGFRLKFTKSTSFIFDYSHAFGREDLTPDHFDPIGAGIEIETGGHVFTLMFTNACGIIQNDQLVNTVDSWQDGGIKFSFIISRMFKMGKPD